MNFRDTIDFLTIASLVVAITGPIFGLDFKKWWSWIFIFCGFLGGFLLLLDLESPASFYWSICIGGFTAIFIALSGWLQKRRAPNPVEFWRDFFRSDDKRDET